MSDISGLPVNEVGPVIVFAVIVALVAALYLNGKARTIVKREGKKGELSFVFTSTGQVAVFVGVLLVIVFAYIILRLA